MEIFRACSEIGTESRPEKVSESGTSVWSGMHCQVQNKKAAVGCGLRSNANATSLFVVFVLVNAPADPVLLPVDASLFRFGEMAIVLGHIFLLAVLDRSLTVFQIGRLLRVQSSVLQTIGDAILLILLALIHFVHARMARIDNARACAGSSS